MSNDSRDKAIRWAEKFYEGLEQLLKRHSPEDYGRVAANLLHNIVGQIDKQVYYPQHLVVNSIEANCAYHRKYLDDPVTFERFNKIIEYYKDYHDPYIKYVLDQGELELFLLVMHRSQFEFQTRPKLRDLARCLLLFVEGSPMPSTSILFQKRYLFDISDWVMLCFAVHAYVSRQRTPIVRIENFTESKVDLIPQNAIIPFFELSSQSPQDFADAYRIRNSKYPPYLHIHLRSLFFKHPLIRFSDGSYLVVHPYLIFHHAHNGLYRLCQDLDPELFGREFGASFERYVGSILSHLDNQIQIISEVQLSSEHESRVCDFLVEFEDCIFLCECKATQYSAQLYTEKAIAGDNSTSKMADAFEQLHVSAVNVHGGVYSKFISNPNKPIVSIVATYGDLPFANSNWYFQHAISNRMSPDILKDWPHPMEVFPQTLHIRVLEELVIVMNSLKQSPLELIKEKLKQEYLAVGDWDQYIGVFNEKVHSWDFPLLDDSTNRFFKVDSSNTD